MQPEQFELPIQVETNPAPFRFPKLSPQEKVTLVTKTLRAIYAAVPKSKKHQNQIKKFVWEQYKLGANSINPACIEAQVTQIEHSAAQKKAQMEIPACKIWPRRMKLSIFKGNKAKVPVAELEPPYKIDAYMCERDRRLAQTHNPSFIPKLAQFTKGVHKLIGGGCYLMAPSSTPAVAVWNGEIFAEQNPTIHVFALVGYSQPEIVLKGFQQCAK